MSLWKNRLPALRLGTRARRDRRVLRRGSADRAEGSVTWSTWGNPEELVFEEFNKDFMERHPDIRVDFQPVASYTDYHSKLTTQLTSGTAPDVFYAGDDRIASLQPTRCSNP